eukprot:CAMPEP_0194275484 /NCGR_PEP_ID=MMETSP0169-20130528/8312_1 /TAXON_ID=218684 /ORGANISM="Corethron pennatum, Strain L29A3" /LENGTH=46 /DNA_ID= /DNA_START= /DNA_END= /DNA_ORIENTATION=
MAAVHTPLVRDQDRIPGLQGDHQSELLAPQQHVQLPVRLPQVPVEP